MRRLNYYYYSSGGNAPIYGAIIACVVVGILFLVTLIAWLKKRRRQKAQAEALAAQAQAQTQMAQMPSSYPAPAYGAPQYATPYAPTPQGYPPPAGMPPPGAGAPAVWFNRSPSRVEMDAMSSEQLAEMGSRMGLSDQANLSRPEYIDLILATQASLGPAASAPASPPDGKPPGAASFKNPDTGVMECGMCMEAMGTGSSSGKAMAVPPCGHLYCYDCLRRVATEGNGACPTCRRTFFEFQVTKIYT